MNAILDPWYITGFVDGEGCFSLIVNTENRRRKEKVSVYRYWVVDFSIHIRADDEPILEEIRKYFGAGRINFVGSAQFPAAHFNIRDRNDLREKVISHFDKYPLAAKKKIDYKLWREAVLILEDAKLRKKSLFSGQSLTEKEEHRLCEIRDEMALRLTNKRRNEYDTVSSLKRTGKEEISNV